MTSLVRYGALAKRGIGSAGLVPYLRNAKRIRTAYNIGVGFHRAGGTRWAARTIQKAWRRRGKFAAKRREKKRAVMSMGRSYNYHSHKKVLQQNFTQAAFNSRKIYAFQFTKLLQGDLLNQRESHRIKAKGVKLRMTFHNAGTGGNINLVRWAVVIPKNVRSSTIVTAGGPPLVGIDSYDDFFTDKIGRNAGVDRDTIDFSVTQCSTDELMYNKINREQFEVLKGGQFMLSGGSDTNLTGYNPPNQMKGWKHVNAWIPLFRSLHYPGAQEQPDSEFPLLMIWCDKINAAAGTASADTGMRLTCLNTFHFDEPY